MDVGKLLLAPQTGTIIWTIVTFIALLILLRRFAWKPVLSLLEERENTIRGSLDDARRAREEAEKHLAESREAMMKARQEISAVIEKGRQEAERLRQQMLEKAQRDADDARRRGLEEIERQKRAAVAEIRAAAVDLAVSAAGRIVKSSMDESAQRKLASDFLSGLDGVERRP